MGIFDCCREKLKPAMLADTRGTSGGIHDEDEGVTDAQNSIYWFGCAENSGVDAKSDMCVMFFQMLR